ncbi:hypothetical protein, partial [Salmonella enterica]|uniref:hypothetical protein n=1 Tax=Salmonella enterica TaxID=28901 RepID=UPI0032B5D10B
RTCKPGRCGLDPAFCAAELCRRLERHRVALGGGETHPIRLIYADPAAKSFVDTPVLDFAPYYRDVLAQFKCPLRCVRLMRLTPGSII